MSNIKMQGYLNVVCLNCDGTLAWEFRNLKNGVTNAGLNYVGGVSFCGGTQFSTWYIGLISTASFSTLSASDTMSSHAGWLEFSSYSGNRPQWTNSSASQRVSSSATFSFAITAAGSLSGIFIVSNATNGGTTGTLFSTVQLPTPAVVSSGQTVVATYYIQFAGG